MGCNCSKNRKPPAGAKTSAQDAQRKGAAEKAAVQTKPTQRFVLQTRSGRTQSFSSKLEADAERIRAGGGTVRRV